MLQYQNRVREAGVDGNAVMARNQKYRLKALSTQQAVEATGDLMSKVNLNTAPVAGAMSAIGHGRQAYGKIMSKYNSAKDKVNQIKTSLGGDTDNATGSSSQSPLRQQELQKQYPAENPSKDPSSNIGALGSEDNVETPAQLSARLSASSKPSITDPSNPFGGGFSGAQAGDDAKEFSQQLGKGAMNVRSMINNAGSKTNTMLGKISTNLQQKKSMLTNAHANLVDDATDTASKVASGVSKGAEAGYTALGAVGDVMDALGPLGDIVGLGLSIFSGVEGHKEEAEKEKAENEQKQALSAPTAPTAETKTQTSLDTSTATAQQMNYQSH